MERRRLLILAGVTAAAVALSAPAAVAHHKPGHRGGPPTTLPATTTTGEPMPTFATNSTTVRVVPDLRGPQPGVVAPAGAQVVAPGNSIASAITAAGAGGTVFLQAGLHRLAAGVTPLANQTLLGEYGAVVDGSVIISGPWTVDGAAWWADAQLPATANATGVCEGGGTNCQPTEDVYRNGQHLTRVMTQGAVGPGTYFGDYPNNRVYVGDDPNNQLIEQAKTEVFIHPNNATAVGVTVRNLQVRKFANPYQRGAVTVGNGAGVGWLVEQCEFYLNHADGVRSFGNTATIRRNILRDNGNLGVGAFNNDFLVVRDNLVTRNNNNGFAVSSEAGGMKLVKIDDGSVVDNEVTYNVGTGIWIDIDARRVVIEHNDVLFNTRHGVHYEISYDGTIRRNRLIGNAHKAVQWNASSRGTVVDNEVRDNGWGLWFIADPARTTPTPTYPEDPRDLFDVTVADNTVRHTSGSNYAAGIDLLNAAPATHLDEVTFNRDDYTLESTSAPRFFYDANNTFAQWQANGKDTDGSVGT